MGEFIAGRQVRERARRREQMPQAPASRDAFHTTNNRRFSWNIRLLCGT
jgi:hypothetical protein